jgi:hypothetical protein
MPEITDRRKLAELEAQQSAPIVDQGMPYNPLAVRGKEVDNRRAEIGANNDILTGKVRANDIEQLPVINALAQAKLEKDLRDNRMAEALGGLPATEFQGKNRILADSGARSLKTLEDLDMAPRNLFQAYAEKFAPWLTNALPEFISGNTEERRLNDSATLGIVDAIARARSGSAVKDEDKLGATSEYQRYYQMYLPRPGDTQETTRNLRKEGRSAVEDLAQEGGYQLTPRIGNDYEKLQLADPTGRMETLPINPQYQVKYNAWLKSHPRGTIKAQDYIKMRQELDSEFGYNSGPADYYLKEANDLNDLSLNYNHTVPGPKRAPMSELKQSRNKAAQEPVGTAATAYANSATLGLPALLAGQEGRDKMSLQREGWPEAALAGDILGSVAGSAALGGAGRLAAEAVLGAKLAPRAGAFARWPGAIEAGGTRGQVAREVLQDGTYGTIMGFNNADEGQGSEGALAGGGFGLLGSGLGQVVGRGLKPLQSAKSQEALNLLADTDTTVMQSLGKTAARSEDTIGSLPIVRTARAKAEASWNQSNLKKAVETAVRADGTPLKFPKDIPAGTASNAEAQKLLSQNYDEILPNIFGTSDPVYHKGVDEVLAPLFRDGRTQTVTKNGLKMGKLRSEGLRSKVEDLRHTAEGGFMDADGNFKGEAFKKTSVELRNLAEKYSRSLDEEVRPLGQIARELRDNLHELAVRVNPKLAKALSSTDKAWSKWVPIREASRAAKDFDGIYGTTQLLQAIGKNTKSKSAIATGRAPGQKEASAAALILGGKVPRKSSFWQTFGAGAGLTLGGPAVLPVATALYAPGVKKVTKKVLVGDRGKAGKVSAKFLSQAVRATASQGAKDALNREEDK